VGQTPKGHSGLTSSPAKPLFAGSILARASLAIRRGVTRRRIWISSRWTCGVDNLSDDVALVTFHLVDGDTLNRRTLVFKRESGWKIVHIRASNLTTR
jgi:hypothetical protein